jgi:hypothetical protein
MWMNDAHDWLMDPFPNKWSLLFVEGLLNFYDWSDHILTAIGNWIVSHPMTMVFVFVCYLVLLTISCILQKREKEERILGYVVKEVELAREYRATHPRRKRTT